MDDYYGYYDYYDYYDHYYWDEAVNKLNNFPLENKWEMRNKNKNKNVQFCSLRL